MTTTGVPRGSSQSFWQRASADWRNLLAPGDITSLIIITALLLVPFFALQAADWPLVTGIIVPLTILSTVFGLIMARSQFGEFLALMMSGIYGASFLVLLTAISLEGGLGNGVYAVFLRAITWLMDALTGGINQDDLVFNLLVGALFWFLGYNAAWHTFRIDRMWRVIIPPGMILFSNTVFYSGDASLDLYLLAFVFLCLLMFVRSTLDAREWEWYTSGIRIPRRLRAQFLRMGVMLAFPALLLGWSVPSGELQERLDRFQQFLQSDPITQMSEFWNRMFSPVDAQGPATADYFGGDTLELGGAIRLGDQTVLVIDAPPDRRYYWRSRVFDTYEAGRWTPAADIRLSTPSPPLNVSGSQDMARETVEQRVTIALNATRLVYTAPQPLQVDVSTRTDLFYTAPEDDPNRYMNISVIRPMQVIRRGQSYNATSLMSVASAGQLRAAGTAYPDWVRNLYLYVSPSVTGRTAQLAVDIVNEAQATTVYDQAKAIESWLRANILYNETIPRPPNGQDPVDWVLFDHREGYCNYYASAMIVMLRTLGIPARLAAGFAQGDWDPAQGGFVVTERDAHTWVEAYFPGYGWIEFEPTAAQAPLEREGEQDFSEQVIPEMAPSATPTETPTPLPTATPAPTDTPEPDEPQDDDAAGLDFPTPTPTITPTYTPSPTPTPVILPTQPAPLPPDAQNPLEMLLPALGVLLMLVLLAVIVIALGVLFYWWWEWRGMHGLSPITRAYARLERYLGLVGIRLATQDTPEERRQHIVTQLPQAERPVTAITRLYTVERYGAAQRRLPTEDHRSYEVADQAWLDARGSIIKRWLRRFTPWRRD